MKITAKLRPFSAWLAVATLAGSMFGCAYKLVFEKRKAKEKVKSGVSP